jgi:hypothetical protein
MWSARAEQCLRDLDDLPPLGFRCRCPNRPDPFRVRRVTYKKVHRFAAEGVRRILRAGVTLAVMGSTVLAALFAPLFAIGAGLSIENAMFHPATDLEVAECILGCVVFLAGIGGALWAAVLGLRRRRWANLYGSLLLLPAYYALLTVAGWWALAELCFEPHFWAKTEHGIARTSRRQGADGAQAETAAAPLSGLAASQA